MVYNDEMLMWLLKTNNNHEKRTRTWNMCQLFIILMYNNRKRITKLKKKNLTKYGIEYLF